MPNNDDIDLAPRYHIGFDNNHQPDDDLIVYPCFDITCVDDHHVLVAEHDYRELVDHATIDVLCSGNYIPVTVVDRHNPTCEPITVHYTDGDYSAPPQDGQ